MKLTLISLALGAGLCWAQAPTDCKPNPLNIPEAKYPCIYPDSRVMYRVVAPNARAKAFPRSNTMALCPCADSTQAVSSGFRKPAQARTRLPNPFPTAIFGPFTTQPFVALENTCRHHWSQRLALRPAPARQSRSQPARGSRGAQPIRPGGDRRGTS